MRTGVRAPYRVLSSPEWFSHGDAVPTCAGKVT
jgi:hypothetical protein